MKYSLSDLIIGIVASSFGSIAVSALASFSGFEPLGQFMLIATGILSYFAITPLIYRKFHLRPLMLPRCPHCKDKRRWFYKEPATASEMGCNSRLSVDAYAKVVPNQQQRRPT